MNLSYHKIVKITITITSICIVNIGINPAFAALPQASGVFDNYASHFLDAISTWDQELTSTAQTVFYALMTISLVWRYLIMAVKGGEMNDIAIDLIRTAMICGVFTWVIQNYTIFFEDIFWGMGDLAANTSGSGTVPTPSSVISYGLDVSGMIYEENVGLSAVGLLSLVVAGAVIVLFVFTGIQLLLSFVSFFFVCYAGIFILALWGTEWTRDSAMMWLKSLLARSFEYFATLLIAQVSMQVFLGLIGDLNNDEIDSWQTLATIFTAATVTYLTIAKLPSMISACIAPIGSSGISAAGFARATGLATAAGMMMSAAKMMTKTLGGAAAHGAYNAGRMGLQHVAPNVSRAASDAWRNSGASEAKSRFMEFFGANPGGETAASMRREFSGRGMSFGNAQQMSQEAAGMMKKQGMSRQDAMGAATANFKSGRTPDVTGGAERMAMQGQDRENSVNGSGSSPRKAVAENSATAAAGGSAPRNGGTGSETDHGASTGSSSSTVAATGEGATMSGFSAPDGENPADISKGDTEHGGTRFAEVLSAPGSDGTVNGTANLSGDVAASGTVSGKASTATAQGHSSGSVTGRMNGSSGISSGNTGTAINRGVERGNSRTDGRGNGNGRFAQFLDPAGAGKVSGMQTSETSGSSATASRYASGAKAVQSSVSSRAGTAGREQPVTASSLSAAGIAGSGVMYSDLSRTGGFDFSEDDGGTGRMEEFLEAGSNDPYSDPGSEDWNRTMMQRADVDLNGPEPGNGQPFSDYYGSNS